MLRLRDLYCITTLEKSWLVGFRNQIGLSDVWNQVMPNALALLPSVLDLTRELVQLYRLWINLWILDNLINNLAEFFFCEKENLGSENLGSNLEL